MSDTPPASDVESVAAGTARRGNALRWAGSVLVAGLGLSVFAPQLPAGWKRLGLMYAGLGALIGGLAGWLATRRQPPLVASPDEGTLIPRPRRMLWLVLLLTLAGLINTAVLSARQYRTTVAANILKDPNAVAYRELLRKGAANNAEAPAQLETLDRRMAPGFREYLAFRFSQLSRRPSPFPELLWGVELALGLLTSGVVYRTVCKRLAD